MRTRTEPREIAKELDRGKGYKSAIDLYATVDRNEAFYTGDQWRGVDAPDVDKPIINVLQRVVSMFVAKVASDDFAANFTPFHEDDMTASTTKMLSGEVDKVIELCEIKRLNKICVRDCAVDGDCCLYTYWDADAPTGQDIRGAIKAEILPNINVHFGNPYNSDPQQQPYILIVRRLPVDEVRTRAEDNGVGEEERMRIRPDEDGNQGEAGNDNKLVTLICKMWRDGDTIQAMECTEDVVVRKQYDTQLTRYPIAWMGWEKVRSSYHGRAALTGLIPNQIAINKIYAGLLYQAKKTAYARVVYDSTRLPQGYKESPGQAIKVTGGVQSIKDAIMYLDGAQINQSVVNLIDNLIQLTRDNMGANDATMGDVNPDNASAIIALQQQDSLPLQLHQQEFYSFVEQQVRNIIDMMRAFYGNRVVQMDMPVIDPMTGEQTMQQQETMYDFGQLTDENMRVRIDIGTSSYWSEQLQVQTLNNIFTSGIMNDPAAFALFLEVMPDKYIPKKAKLQAYAENLLQQAAMAPTLTEGQQIVTDQPTAGGNKEPTIAQ